MVDKIPHENSPFKHVNTGIKQKNIPYLKRMKWLAYHWRNKNIFLVVQDVCRALNLEEKNIIFIQ